MDSRNKLYAKMGVTIAIAYRLLAIAMITLRPDPGVYWRTIREWTIGEIWMDNGMHICFPGFKLFVFAALHSTNHTGKVWKIGFTVLFTSVAGTVGAGIFVSGPYPPSFTITHIYLMANKEIIY